MKKLFVVLALAGMTASVSATAISVANKSAIVSVNGDPKKDKSKKACCSDTTKCKGGKCCKDKSKSKADAPKN